ncbi:MAG: anti-sigma factor antagonist [Spirochaetales bacterium]|nr:anti-sigma factor antagonist [Spirochaetales bacterium]
MDIKSINVEDGRVKLEVNDDMVVIKGEIDHMNPKEFMEDFLNSVHNEAVNTGMKKVKVDIGDLTFLNSSGIKELLKWIIKLSQLDTDKRYSIVFLYNPEVTWQPLSLEMLVKLAPQNIILQGKEDKIL